MRVTRDQLPPLSVERFDYSRIGDTWAVVRLVARLREGVGLPAAASLVAGHDGSHAYPARACVSERRLRQDEMGDGDLLWRAAFAVPAAIVEDAPASFSLTAGDACLICLPAPARRTITRRSLSLHPVTAPKPGALATLRSRRRATAVATIAALTATSSPAAAFASAASTSSSHHRERGPRAAGAAAVATAAGAVASIPAPAATTPSTTTSATASTTSTTSTTTTAAATATATTSTTASPTTTTPTATTVTPVVTPVVTTAIRQVHRHHRLPAATVVRLPAAGASSRHHAGRRPASSGHGATARHHAPEAPSFPIATRPAPSGRGSAQRRTARRREAAARRRIAILSAGVRQAAAYERAERREREAAARGAHRFSTTSGPSTGVHMLGSTPGFTGPSSWTGTVSADPSLTGAVRNLSGLLSNGNRPPSFLIPIYMRAAKRYHLPWQVLAAINAIETDYGRDLNTSSAGAVGWMQFEPSTWKDYATAVDGVSEPNPYDPRDAIFAAARYLAAAGGAEDIRRAVFAYNHAGWYVDEVMQRAEAIARHVQFEKTSTGRLGVISVDFATDLTHHPRVRYRSGWLSHYDRLIAAANMVSAADFPYVWGGGHEQPSRFGPFDCSGSVSYVMQQAGYRVPTTVSGDVAGWHLPAGPGRVTIFYNAVHTFMRIGGRYFGTSGFARPGGGAGWFDVDRLPAGYLAQFNEVHVPRLGIDSFAPHSERFLVDAQRVHRPHRVTRMSIPRAAIFEALVRDGHHRLVRRVGF